MQKTMKWGQRSKSNLSIAVLLILSPQSGSIIRNTGYYLSLLLALHKEIQLLSIWGTQRVPEHAGACLICQYPGWCHLQRLCKSNISFQNSFKTFRVSYGAEGTLQKRTPSLSCRFVLSSIWRRKVVREFQPKYESHLITDWTSKAACVPFLSTW